MKKLLILPLLILFFSVLVFAQTEHNFSGVIKNRNSEVIAGANMYLKKDGKRKIITTDINGKFNTKLTAGDYEITLNDVVSKTFKAYIKIQDNAVNPNNVVFTIKLNKSLCGLEENENCPKPIKLPKPAYPGAARSLGLRNESIAFVKINDKGRVISVKSDAHPLLRKVVEKAAKDSVFEKSDKKYRELRIIYTFLEDKEKNKETNLYSSLYRVNFFIYSPKIEID